MDIQEFVKTREFIDAVSNQVSIELDKRQTQSSTSTAQAHQAAIQAFSEIATKSKDHGKG